MSQGENFPARNNEKLERRVETLMPGIEKSDAVAAWEMIFSGSEIASMPASLVLSWEQQKFRCVHMQMPLSGGQRHVCTVLLLVGLHTAPGEVAVLPSQDYVIMPYSDPILGRVTLEVLGLDVKHQICRITQ